MKHRFPHRPHACIVAVSSGIGMKDKPQKTGLASLRKANQEN